MKLGLCAVILTHFSPEIQKYNYSSAHCYLRYCKCLWADVSINTGLFNNSELAIGIHMQRAIKATFEKYTWCQAIAVIEDDLELAPTYFEALNAVYDNLLSLQPSCFTCVNDLGFKYLGPWDSTSIKPVTNSMGLGLLYQELLLII